jgi:hypothetical protein
VQTWISLFDILSLGGTHVVSAKNKKVKRSLCNIQYYYLAMTWHTLQFLMLDSALRDCIAGSSTITESAFENFSMLVF